VHGLRLHSLLHFQQKGMLAPSFTCFYPCLHCVSLFSLYLYFILTRLFFLFCHSTTAGSVARLCALAAPATRLLSQTSLTNACASAISAWKVRRKTLPQERATPPLRFPPPLSPLNLLPRRSPFLVPKTAGHLGLPILRAPQSQPSALPPRRSPWTQMTRSLMVRRRRSLRWRRMAQLPSSQGFRSLMGVSCQ